jgi:transcription elongation factor Elf1
MTKFIEPPDGWVHPKGKDWKDLAPATRYYYRNKENELQRINKRKLRIKKWLQKYKADRGCSKCGEQDPRCLDFHHKRDNKNKGIAELTHSGYSKEKIKKEIRKCTLVCANCHRKIHLDLF